MFVKRKKYQENLWFVFLYFLWLLLYVLYQLMILVSVCPLFSDNPDLDVILLYIYIHAFVYPTVGYRMPRNEGPLS